MFSRFRVQALVLAHLILMAPGLSFAAGGIDTADGTKALPFNLEGQQAMTLDEATGLTVNKGVVAGGPVHPGSIGVVEGGACSTQGDTAYDLQNDEPVYCNKSRIWTTASSGGGSGSWCGLSYYDAGYAYSVGAMPEYHTGGSYTVLCEGLIPARWNGQAWGNNYGCPPGYSYNDPGFGVCIKN